MITNPIEKSKGRGLGVYRFPLSFRPEKILEIRFIDSCLQLSSIIIKDMSKWEKRNLALWVLIMVAALILTIGD
jgi:hypothetical protein